MKQRMFAALAVVCLLLAAMPFSALAADEAIVILYENDVHCAIEGYAKLSAMKQELAAEGKYVGVVSCGDYIQGSSLGAISQGEYIVNAMNMVGYDALALGNHEFDYRLERLQTLVEAMDTKPVCCNFQTLDASAPVFEPYRIVSYGDVDVAYVGVTTPDTLTSSSPSQFMDGTGAYIYTFHSTDLYDVVQQSIDAAKAEGADYVVALAHLGTEFVNQDWSAQALVQHTDGLDVVLDGHSHSVVESMTVADKSGDEVLISSTGTKFAHIGQLTIAADGTLSTTLIPTESYEKQDGEILAYIEQINEEYAALGNRHIGDSTVTLTTVDENGNRIIRHQETNLGDFCADAFRLVTGADVGVINGGGIRDDLDAGEITFNDILSVFPFNNTVCVAEVTGQQLLDFLELTAMLYPDENGSFQHVSGLRYAIDEKVPTSVVLDENGVFVRVEGERRVWGVAVLDAQTGQYEPLDPMASYTVASHNYLLIDHGSGASMFNEAAILENSGMLDVELLEVYITEHLNGVIGDEYTASQGRITVGAKPTDATTTTASAVTTTTVRAATPSAPSSPKTDDAACLPVYIAVAAVAIGMLLIVSAHRKTDKVV